MSLSVTFTYGDLQTVPAYVLDDIDMINAVIAEQNSDAGRLEEKNAREFAARLKRGD